jgi:hypothetical protein
VETPPVETPPTPPATDEPVRRRVWTHVRSHPVRYGVLAAVVVAVLAVVLFWFQPQTLLFDRVVDEEFPAAEPAEDPAEAMEPAEDDADEAEPAEDPADDEPPPDGAEPVALVSGEFSPRGRYDGEGTATVFELADGQRMLRFEDFTTSNGPDLFVYLSVAPADTPSDLDFDDEFVNLGVLKGNIGPQNYDVPPDVDLDDYESVVIWCRRFTVAFAAADLH